MKSSDASAIGIAPRPGGHKPFWLARSTRTIFFFAAVLTVAGIYLAFKVPISVFPETNFPRVIVAVDNGVMPVEQMEVTITRPIEDAVNSVPGLETVRSTTGRGSAEVSLFFNWNVDMVAELQLVDSALSTVRQSLPATASITTRRLTFASFPVLGYCLTSDTVPQTRLWEIATYNLKPPLNRVAGVSTVLVQGGQVPEFHVVPNLALMQAAAVTVPDLVSAIEASNIVDSPGLYEANHQLILGLVGAQVHDIDGIRQLVVKTTLSGAPVRVADVATVEDSTLPVYTSVSANGKKAVLVSLMRQPTSNTVAVADAVASQIAKLRKDLPEGVKLELFYDQSQPVRDAISSVRDAIFIGLVLACIILFFFLRDWTSSLIAGLVIPVTIAVTFVVLWMMGESFNLMTLGGLAAAIGLVIDDAIVVVENIVHAPRRRGASHRGGSQSAARADCATARFHHYARGCVSASGRGQRRHRPVLPRPGRHHDRRAAHLAGAGAYLDARPQLCAAARGAQPQGPHHQRRPAALPDCSAFIAACSTGRWPSRSGSAEFACCWSLAPGAATRLSAPTCCRRWTKAASSSTTSCPPAARWPKPTAFWITWSASCTPCPRSRATSRRTGMQLGYAAVTEANTGDFHRQAQVQAQPLGLGSDERCARAHQEDRARARHRAHADPAGQHQRPFQCTRADPDQALLERRAIARPSWDPGLATPSRKIPGVVDVEDGIENTISGPATNFQVDPTVASRLGFTPDEVSKDATSILDGIPDQRPLIANGRQYTIRVRLEQYEPSVT